MGEFLVQERGIVGGKVGALGEEGGNGRLLALEGVDGVLGVGGDGGDHGEGLALGQLCPVFVDGVGVVAGAEGGLGWPPVGVWWWGVLYTLAGVGGCAFRILEALEVGLGDCPCGLVEAGEEGLTGHIHQT